jgi:hypothetical protein
MIDEELEVKMREVPFISALMPQYERRWNWSEFFAAVIGDWDVETGTFLQDMRDGHALPSDIIPFAVHRSGLEYSDETLSRFQAARTAAESYITDNRRLFVTTESYNRHFGDMGAGYRGAAKKNGGA